MKPEVIVKRWERSIKPEKKELLTLLQAEGLHPYSWSNGPGEGYPAHSHNYNKVIIVVTGSITFGLPSTGEQMVLNPGDRMELPAGTLHDAVVGLHGVVCLEAQR